MKVFIPIRTSRGQNNREHWRARARRVKKERQSVYWGLRPVPLPVVVTLVRHSPGTLDGDNLQGALKAIRDGVADVLKTDDRDPGIEWRYDQVRSKEWGVSVEVVPASATPA